MFQDVENLKCKKKDSQTSARGVEMTTKPRLTVHTMCVSIMQTCFGLCLVCIMPSGRATILKHMTAAHVHALHWMCTLANSVELSI